MKIVTFKVVCILAIVFPVIPKLKTPSFALGYHNCINKKLRQLMLPSIVLIAGLFISVDLSSQWERIPDFNIGCNDMVLAHEDTLWGGGYQKLIKYSISGNSMTYYTLEKPYLIKSINRYSDSVAIISGYFWVEGVTIPNGFVSLYDFQKDSLRDLGIFPYPVNDTYILSKDTVFAVGLAGVIGTLDSGENWDTLYSITGSGALYGELYNITYSNGVLYASGTKAQDVNGSLDQGIVIKSEWTFTQWSIILEDYDGYYKFDIRVHPENSDLIYCHDYGKFSYFYSLDAGQTWQNKLIPINDPWMGIADMIFINEDTIIAAIEQEYLIPSMYFTVNLMAFSADQGESWGIQFENYPGIPLKDTTLISLLQMNDSTLFASGWNLLLKTQNLGGPVWPIKSVKPEIIKDLSVYPNPATDFIKVKGMKEDFDYQIIDIQGRVVKEGRCESFSEIRLDSIQKGYHLLMIRTEELSTCFLI
ncbi:MAG: T9SS type A sorting domain-containing protein, partial [Bacteroidales bacterium]